VAGSLLLLLVVVVAGSLYSSSSSSSPPPLLLGPSFSRSRYQGCGVHHAERGVAHISAKGCSACCGVGEVRGTKVRGRNCWQRCEGRVGGDCVREAFSLLS
jgi:hypothetical protein